MNIQAFPSGPFDTNAYVAACSETKSAAVVDPAPHSTDAITAYLTENHLIPKMILITHSHWDHIGDTAELKRKLNIPIYIHKLDAPNLIKPGSDGLPGWSSIEGVKPDKYLVDGDTIPLGNLLFEVIHTPGHTPGGSCFYCKKQHILFSGDTLFQGSIGNLSLPTSNPDHMWPSLEKLAALPSETTVYPGHGEPTTIKKESWLPKAKEYFGG